VLHENFTAFQMKSLLFANNQARLMRFQWWAVAPKAVVM
jgi:hypothetical protein